MLHASISIASLAPSLDVELIDRLVIEWREREREERLTSPFIGLEGRGRERSNGTNEQLARQTYGINAEKEGRSDAEIEREEDLGQALCSLSTVSHDS